MKTNIKSFLAAGLGLLTLGCTDLHVPVESQYTEYPSSEAAVEAKMANIYFQMRDCMGRRFMEAMALSSDEFTAVSYSGNWVDSYAYAHPSLHDYAYEDATIDWMGVLGEGVVKANEVINSDAAEKYVAAARAMRAYFTFVMMDCWGDAPIIDETVEGIDIRDRQPRADVAAYIESELLAIKDKLPEDVNGDNYGKPSKYMALALLAKLYINWPVYTATSVDQYDASTATNAKLNDCISVCDEIISSGKFHLGSMAYRFKFAPNNTDLNVEDFIYVMPYDTYDATGMQYGRSHSYKDIKSMSPSYYGETLSNAGGGYMTMTPECSSLFHLVGDERNNCVIGDTVYVYDPTTLLPTSTVALNRNGEPLVLTKDITLVTQDATIDVGDNLNGWRQGYRSVKWFVKNDDYKNGRNQSNDVPIFRYADILLTKAEAIARGGTATNGETAMSLFNQIRSYVNAPTITSEPSLDDIYEERGREFFDENWRRNDMIRFGHYEDEYFPHYKGFPGANFEKTRRIFPIHKSALDLNTSWKQNPGY